MSNVLYVGLHIHKAAGTTLQVHLEKHLKKGFIHTNPIVNFQEGVTVVDELMHSALERKKAIWGHWVHESMFKGTTRDVFLFTFLREPMSRMQSWYKYEKRKFKIAQPFSEFAEARKNNMCRAIIRAFPSMVTADEDSGLAAKAISILEKFGFVGTQENFARDSSLLLGMMNIDPIDDESRLNVGTRDCMNDIESDLISKLFEEDIKLYEWVTSDPRGYVSNKNTIRASDLSYVGAGFAKNIGERLLQELADLRVNKMDAERIANDKLIIARRLLSLFIASSEKDSEYIAAYLKLISRDFGIGINFDAVKSLRNRYPGMNK